MKIVADQDIPLVDYYFGHCGEISYKSGRSLVREDLLDADMLLVRSVTTVNETLLQGTSVRFVGTPGSGIDHLDTDWLDLQEICWVSASGCNANAVVDYMTCVIAALQKAQSLASVKPRAGVVGVGVIGSRIVEKLKLLNFDVVQCDPFRAKNEPDFIHTPLKEFHDLDFITLHVPLTHAGSHPTFHLIEKKFLKRQKPGCVLLNAARGEVVHTADMKKFGTHLIRCFDVWENEPTIDLELLESTVLATPHIAGHSIQAKYRGIQMIYQKARTMGIISGQSIPPKEYPRKTVSFQGQTLTWQDVILKLFDIQECTRILKTELLNKKSPNAFDRIRKEWGERYEFDFVDIKEVKLSERDKVLLGL